MEEGRWKLEYNKPCGDKGSLVWGGECEPRAAPYDNKWIEKKVIHSVHAIYWIAMKANVNDQSQAFGTYIIVNGTRQKTKKKVNSNHAPQLRHYR
jgi:hypothetical protein